MEYALKNQDRVDRVKSDAAALMGKFPGVEPHEIPLKELVMATSDFLEKDPSFRLTPYSRKQPYSYYDIPHVLLSERVLSRLKDEGFIHARDEEKVRQALSRLHYRRIIREGAAIAQGWTFWTRLSPRQETS